MKRLWNVYLFTKPNKRELLGVVEAENGPDALIEARKKWPEFGGWQKDYPIGRLVVRKPNQGV